jgi:hypothetical protein
MSALVLLPKGTHRQIAQANWGLTDGQMKGMHVHHRIPRSKGGTDAPENLYVCSPSFHANVWHGGLYRIIQKASEVARLGGQARQRAGLTPEGLHKMKLWGKEIGTKNKQKGIGLFARDAQKRSEDARKAGKIGIRSTLSRNPNHMRDMGLKGGAPGKSVVVVIEGVETIYKSISKAIKATGVSRTLAYKALREFGEYSEKSYYFFLQ